MDLKPARMTPITGMDNRSDDAELWVLGEQPSMRVRDALNVDVTGDGRLRMRRGWRLVTGAAYRDLWQNPVHGDVFGRMGAEWVRINDMAAGQHEVLADIGEDRGCAHTLLNNKVMVASLAGVWEFDGDAAQPLGMQRPAGPVLGVDLGAGSLPAGRYGFCVAWVRDGQESGTSEVVFADVPDQSAVTVTPPLCMEPGVSAARIYMTATNGGDFHLEVDAPLGTSQAFPLPTLAGRPPMFPSMEPMPGGVFLQAWRGRIVTARANVLRFSQPLAYHVHDPIRDHVTLPQRITFVVAMDGGIWVGQRDRVVFLAGDQPAALRVASHHAGAPVPGSAVVAMPGELSGELGMSQAAVWLGEYGYVAGTPSGEAINLQKSALSGLSGASGTSVVFEQRAYTAVN